MWGGKKKRLSDGRKKGGKEGRKKEEEEGTVAGKRSEEKERWGNGRGVETGTNEG